MKPLATECRLAASPALAIIAALLRQFLDRWREHFVGRAFRGGLVTPAELDGMPHFAFAEEPLSATAQRAFRGITLMLIPTFLLVGVTAWKLRRVPRM